MACAGGLMLLLLSAVVPGAPAPDAPAPGPRGVVFIVGGVGGIDFIGCSARWALGRVPHEVREFAWTHGKGRLLRDLQDTRYFLLKARQLADVVRQLKAENPARPVYLVGHSGGAGLVLAAAEQLPPATLERIIVLSAAVAPNYDLRPALQATRGQIVSFSSTLDLFWLYWGTSQFGTVDRFYGPAAGYTGFVVPRDLCPADRELYRRLVQVTWEPGMILACYGGMLHSTTMPCFLARHVAPWLR
jgi:pimeloyl-ACP methyl ester carboxylesterase